MAKKTLPLTAPRQPLGNAKSRAMGRSPAVQDVAIQDQTTNSLILPMVQTLGTAILTADAVVESRIINLDDVTGLSVGDHVRIISSLADKYYFGTALEINGNDVTVDNLIDYPYPAGSEFTFNNINMAVDGSVTPVHFHLRTGSPSIPSAVDITHLIMVCECANAVDLNKFADIDGGLTRGCLFRSSNAAIHNIWNVKSNRDLVSLAYDWTPFTASNPALGINGFSWRLTFNGQEKMGVAIRIEQDGQLGLIIQDDLTSLTSLIVVLEGHVVLP